jgi:hypothetical protein
LTDPLKRGLQANECPGTFVPFIFVFALLPRQAWQHSKTKMPAIAGHSLAWRRERDSNPRTCYSQRFSRPPHSTALPSLRRKYRWQAETNKIIFNSLLFFFFAVFLFDQYQASQVYLHRQHTNLHHRLFTPQLQHLAHLQILFHLHLISHLDITIYLFIF